MFNIEKKKDVLYIFHKDPCRIKAFIARWLLGSTSLMALPYEESKLPSLFNDQQNVTSVFLITLHLMLLNTFNNYSIIPKNHLLGQDNPVELFISTLICSVHANFLTAFLV